MLFIKGAIEKRVSIVVKKRISQAEKLHAETCKKIDDSAKRDIAAIKVQVDIDKNEHAERMVDDILTK